MPTYLLVYRSETNSPPADQDVMAAWQAFFEELGSSLADLGNPIFARNELGDCSNATTVLGGYSIITADDTQTAIELAGRCPELSREGGVEVGEITLLSADGAAGITDHDAQAASRPISSPTRMSWRLRRDAPRETRFVDRAAEPAYQTG